MGHFDMTIRQAYAALGLDASSTTPDQVRMRFRDLIRSNHPDGKPSHEQARANEATRIIVEACTLLRAKGFPRETTFSRAAEACGSPNGRAAAVVPDCPKPHAWLDEMWRDCLYGSLVCFASPVFGVRFAFSLWTLGLEITMVHRSGSR